MIDWYKISVSDTAAKLNTGINIGLSESQADELLNKYGPNELTSKKHVSVINIFLRQFLNVMIFLLMAAALIAFLMKDFNDFAAILVIIILNAAIGFRQEYKAEKTLEALKKLATPRVTVIRGGKKVLLESNKLVPGDILEFKTGDFVSADSRIIDAVNLQMQEAALTGESMPVYKKTEAINKQAGLGDRFNMGFMGTKVSGGRGRAIVVATGMDTQLGKIAASTQSAGKVKTPLQKKIGQLGVWLAILSVFLVCIVFLMGLLRGEDLRELILVAISLAVAAVPEGLPAVITVTLAVGAGRMLKQNALIRKLTAVETLGSVTVICSDKTGTITQNKMSVSSIFVPDIFEPVDISKITENDLENITGFNLLFVNALLCNDAELGDTGMITSNPTELALLKAVGRYEYKTKKGLKRIVEIPFESEKKRMTTVYSLGSISSMISLPKGLRLPNELLGGSNIVFTKGGLESVLSICGRIFIDNKINLLRKDDRERIIGIHNKISSSGERVLAFAIKTTNGFSKDSSTYEQNLIFIGLIGLIDPPRPEIKEAVKIAKNAGIRLIMITGDYPLTASNIAERVGIDSTQIITGRQMSSATLDELDGIVAKNNIYARVSPEHKLTIIDSLQKGKNIVAMTGDGINDAPALKKADVGIAMGISGTEVSKEASDIVLLDDNFASIIKAVREGRVIFDNIRKFIKFLLSGNTGELFVMFVSPFLSMPLALTPLQILWINLLTDGLPAISLGIEPAEVNAMQRPPKKIGEPIINKAVIVDILWIGLFSGMIALLIGYYNWSQQADVPLGAASWQTMIFASLTFMQMGIVLAIRSNRSVLKSSFFSNKPLILSVIFSIIAQLIVIYTPFFHRYFDTVSLSIKELSTCFLSGIIIFAFIELKKMFIRKDA